MHQCEGDPARYGDTLINPRLILRCSTCGKEKKIFEEVFDCGTHIPGNPHQASQAKKQGRALQGDWRGIRDGVLAGIDAEHMKVTAKWRQNFETEMAKERF